MKWLKYLPQVINVGGSLASVVNVLLQAMGVLALLVVLMLALSPRKAKEVVKSGQPEAVYGACIVICMCVICYTIRRILGKD